MKNILLILIVFLSAGILQVNAQEVKKEIKKEVKKEVKKEGDEKVVKKVVIKKKTVKDDGTVVEEVIEAEGAEADDLIKKMKEEDDFEGIDMEMEMDGGMTEKKIKIKKDHKVIHKSHGDEKMIKVGVDTIKDEDGENVFVIKVDDGDGEKEFNWTSKDGEMPEEMKKYMKEGNMIIHLDEEGEGDMNEFIVKVESDEALPDVNVRMGVELINTESTLEVGSVQKGSPASEAGLTSEDMITEIDGYYIPDYAGLMERLSMYKPGDHIEVRYIRAGKAHTTKLKLAAKE